MKTILTIMKKELKRFLADKRTLISILLPGLLIYVMYSFMGEGIMKQFAPEPDYRPTVKTVGVPQSLDQALRNVFEIEEADAENAKKAVQDGTADLLILFPQEFDQKVADYSIQNGSPAPNIQIYYNSTQTNSQTAYDIATGLLNTYEESLINKFDINADGQYDLASEKDLTGTIFSAMMPMLLMIFLFTGCLAVAPESIAGEKERGTIATLLVTPVKRSHIALGKILALSIIALISGASSTIGTLLSLPKLMGASGALDQTAYTVQDYTLLGLVILSTVLVIVTLIAIVSAFAKSTKEAQTYATPLMLLVVVLGVFAMFGGAQESILPYCIPLYNTTQCMIQIFSFAVNPAYIAVTVCINLAVTAIGTFILTKMFNNEKIMFSK